MLQKIEHFLNKNFLHRFFFIKKNLKKMKEKAGSNAKEAFKISTINVASINAAWGKGFLEWVSESKPDLICVQETKLHADSKPSHSSYFLDGYNGYFFDCSASNGLHGTAIFSKIQPISVKESFNDDEGRCITIEFSKFYVVNTYVPNAGMKLERLNWKVKTWNPKVQKHLDELRKTKPAFWTGDLNVAHEDIDIFEPAGHEMTAGFTKEEREWFGSFLDSGYVDIFRKLYPDRKEFTFFSYRAQAKLKNHGWRLDYFCLHKDDFRDGLIIDCTIEKGDFSDHVPLSLYLNREMVLTDDDKPVESPVNVRLNNNLVIPISEQVPWFSKSKGKAKTAAAPQQTTESKPKGRVASRLSAREKKPTKKAKDEDEDEDQEENEEIEKPKQGRRGRKPSKAQEKKEEEEQEDDDEEKPKQTRGRRTKSPQALPAPSTSRMATRTSRKTVQFSSDEEDAKPSPKRKASRSPKRSKK